MDRTKIANTLLYKLDWAIGNTFKGLDGLHLFKPAADLMYIGLKQLMKTQFSVLNDLEIVGLENVPEENGVILASNHQSWLDVQVLGAACPRKVHFLAKSEFKNWPVIRHLVRFGESVYIERVGGNPNALEEIARKLKEGWVVAIYPEGTIPGEENIPRRAVEPETGLLPGRTGAVRLAILANVPIVPVGVSGTSRALPPEVYPRLEVLRMPGRTPITIRFGEPISYEKFVGKPFDRHLIRSQTDALMKRISDLVDHRSSFYPVQVPIPKPIKKKRVGVLLLHGFTSNLAAIDGILPRLQKANLKVDMPVLRGHGTRYEDLVGVTAVDWYADAERALIDLWHDVDQVVVVGFSMGALVGLELSMRHPDKIASLVTVAACLKFADPLARFSRRFAHVIKYWQSPNPYNDEERRKQSKNYVKFPTETFASLYDYSREIIDRLPEVHVPIRILQSKKDQIVSPVSANIIYEKVSSPRRDLIWYQESGHEMMDDLEREKVYDDILEFVKTFVADVAAQ